MGKELKKLRGYDLVKTDGTRGLVKLTSSNISTYKFKDTLSYENAPSGYLNVRYIVPTPAVGGFKYHDRLGVNVIDGYLRYRGDSNYQPDSDDSIILTNYSPYLGGGGWEYESCKIIQIPDDAVVTTEGGVDVTTEFFAWLNINADKFSEESVIGTWQINEDIPTDISAQIFAIEGSFKVVDKDAWAFVTVPLAQFQCNGGINGVSLSSDETLTYNKYYMNVDINDGNGARPSIWTQLYGVGYTVIPKTNVNAPTLRTFQITGGDDVSKEAFVNVLKAVATRIS